MIFITAPLKLATTGDALRVRKQDDLQFDGRIIGWANCVVVFIAWVKITQINLSINQVVQ
jgi:hypothetical protein